ncbi:uncharacterized protein LOC129784364 [Falco peregrinus]|uniref:uncharacterized protein LOC129784364 n=1 Tax=Falco peregrinus TaxID=8954 RepID=UPI00247A7031|nr:uncharacterized protein LOC129784364 [Falco peregrinus]
MADPGAGIMIAMEMEPQNTVCPNKRHAGQLPQHRAARSSWCSCPSGNPQPAVPASIAPHHPPLLLPTERFPLQLPTGPEVPSMSFTTLTMPPPVTAGVLPSVPGLLITVRPSQLHTITHQPALATWQGVQGPLGDSGQVVQLPHVLQLPSGVQLPPLPAPCPPAYGRGQQVVMGTLVPHQPVGLGPWAVGQGQPLYPTGCTVLNVPAHAGPLPPQHPAAQHCVQVSPVLRTHPGSTQKLLEAFNNDVVASEDGVPAATPCQPALDMLSGRSRTKHQEVVTTPPSPENLLDLPELGPDAFNEAFPELAEDNLQFQDEHSSTVDSSDPLAWLDSILELPEVLSGSCLTTLLNKFPEFSEYVAKGGCSKEQSLAAGLGGSEDTDRGVPDVPVLTTTLNRIPDLLECMMEGNCPKDQVVAAMQEDTNPSWQRVATSPLLDAKGKQGGLAAVFPTRLPESPMEPSQEGPMDTSEESPLKGCSEGAHKGLPEGPQQILLNSPLASPPTAPQHHLPCMAQLVEEVLRRQPRVILTHLPPPLGIFSCRVVPRSGKAAGKQAKRPTLADTLGMPEMSPRGSMPPKKRKKMVVCPVAKSSKTLWEGKPHRDATAVGCSGEQGGSSKQRPSNSDYVPTKRARTLRNTRRQGAPRCPSRR